MRFGTHVSAWFEEWEEVAAVTEEKLKLPPGEGRAAMIRQIQTDFVEAVKLDMLEPIDREEVQRRTGWSDSTFYRRRKELTNVGTKAEPRYLPIELPYGPGEAPFEADVAKRSEAQKSGDPVKSRIGRSTLRVVGNGE